MSVLDPATLRAAADHIVNSKGLGTPQANQGANWAAAELRRMADAASAQDGKGTREGELTRARDAAADMLEAETGERRPAWRVIYTDSESPTGIAPVCAAEGVDDEHHVIADYPGGPMRDGQGVYDCCPTPQIETCSPVMAAYLVELLNADRQAGDRA